jgi:hypothetical protein
VSGIRFARIFWIGAAAILVVAALVGVGRILRGDFDPRLTPGERLLLRRRV